MLARTLGIIVLAVLLNGDMELFICVQLGEQKV